MKGHHGKGEDPSQGGASTHGFRWQMDQPGSQPVQAQETHVRAQVPIEGQLG